MGRIDHQIKIRGFRIEPGEIETLLGQHPSVQEAVIVAREDTPGNKHLVAYVVPYEKSAFTEITLRNFLKEKLPAYMIPAVFVMLNSLPLTPNGKVDRKVLPEPAHIVPGTGQTYVAPRNKLEIQLTEIWEKILDIRPVGIKDNFFELGGHSLIAVRVASVITKITKRKFPVMAIFQSPTIEQLAEMLAKEECSVQFSSLMQILLGDLDHLSLGAWPAKR
jgi:aspartate racemase